MICVSSYLEKKAKSSFVSTVNPVFVPFPTPDAITIPKDFNGKLKISYAGGITASKGCENFPAVISLLDEKASTMNSTYSGRVICYNLCVCS